MELPSYKWPSPRTVLFRVADRAWIFLRTAGTLILTIAILVWAAGYYPHDPHVVAPLAGQRARLEAEQAAATDGPKRDAIAAEITHVDHQMAAVYQQHSLLGRLGRLIEPAVKPLGWDWRIGCAVLASLPAREVVVATLGVVYGLGREVDPGSAEGFGQLQSRLHKATWDDTGAPVFTIPVALSLMVSRGPLAHGVLRPLRAMRGHVGRHPPRDEQLALAVVHLHLHDGAGLRGGAGDVPRGNVAGVGVWKQQV
jgi:ferrous iron transport protein B